MKIAHKLMNISGDPTIKQKNLIDNFKIHQNAKAVLCKLPIINMAENQFSHGLGAGSRGDFMMS